MVALQKLAQSVERHRIQNNHSQPATAAAIKTCLLSRCELLKVFATVWQLMSFSGTSKSGNPVQHRCKQPDSKVASSDPMSYSARPACNRTIICCAAVLCVACAKCWFLATSSPQDNHQATARHCCNRDAVSNIKIVWSEQARQCPEYVLVPEQQATKKRRRSSANR